MDSYQKLDIEDGLYDEEDIFNEEEDDFDREYDEIPIVDDADPTSSVGDSPMAEDAEATYSDLESEETKSVVEKKPRDIKWTEQVDIIRLRSKIDALASEIQEKDNALMHNREELNKCRDQLRKLDTERNKVREDLLEAETTNNVAASLRLKSELLRNQTEMESEVNLMEQLKNTISDAEYNLAKAQVKQGKLIVIESRLKEQEQQLERQKIAIATNRQRKENKAVQRTIRTLATEQSSIRKAQEAEYDRAEELLKDAEKSQEKAKKFLANTISKLKEREITEEKRQQQHMKQRMNTILALKRDISLNKENFKALKAQEDKREMLKKEEEEREKEIILASGKNVSVEMMKRRRQQEIEQAKMEAKKKEKLGLLTIVDKLNKENEAMQRKKLVNPQLFTDAVTERAKIVKPHKKRQLKSLHYMGKSLETDEKLEVFDMSRFEGMTGDESDAEDEVTVTEVTMTSSQDSHRPSLQLEINTNNSLARPEFEGMWDKKTTKAVVVHEADDKRTAPKRSKMEQEIFQRNLVKLQESAIVQQVAAGRKFSGQAFSCKPNVVCFPDLEVGKVYTKRVALTNISYTVNHCKLTGLSECLKDFIELKFDPPGPMSAGMTCELLVTFKPRVNEDIEGEVSFLSQTGPFNLPIKCCIKKCVLSVDQVKVDFGTSVIGECIKKTVVLKNSGALGTRFTFSKITGNERVVSTASTQGYLSTISDNAAQSATRENSSVSDVHLQQKREASDETQHAGNEHVSEVVFSEDLLQELSQLDGVTVGDVSSGAIQPHSTVNLQLVWKPTLIGHTTANFAITFDDPHSPKIPIEVTVNAIDVPVWVNKPNLDMKICMYDRLYQDTVVVNNSASTALRLQFDVCKELRSHLEVLPKTGYIQAKSKFSAQLKFLPRQSLPDDAGEYFDRETGILEVPITITVAGQSRPVIFIMQAVVTTTQLTMGQNELDFGHCTIHEKVITKLAITNHSLLPQEYGFVNLPPCVDVQPNDGFGTLLPQETIEVDIIFQPTKADVYDVEVKCKTMIGREFKIRCQGIGVLPPLELSQQVINFRATSPGDTSVASFYIINNHKDDNEFTHAVPRMGKGKIAPVGPTSYEFVVPEGSPLTLAPSVGVLQPGEKQRIQVRFSPTLRDADIRQEAVRMIKKQLQDLAEKEEEEKRQQALAREAELAEEQASGKKKTVKSQSPVKTENQAKVKAKPDEPSLPPQAPREDQIQENSTDYNAAKLALLLRLSGRVDSYTIACHIASGDCRKTTELEYSLHNTLYLQCHCPTRRQPLVIMSDHGSNLVDFGDVSVGLKTIKTVTVQNIMPCSVDLHSSPLDTEGPFDMVNPLRKLLPQGVHTISLSFTPQASQKFQEVLAIQCGTFTLNIILKGRGIDPEVKLSANGNIDMGAILAGEFREETFQITNVSTLSVRYCIRLESQSPLRHAKGQEMPHFIQRHLPKKTLVGVQNYNGQAVFDCVPAEGLIEPGQARDIVITFSPDHPSDFYSDVVHIELFGQADYASFNVIGQAKSHMAYLEGGDSVQAGIESMSSKPPEDIDPEAKPLPAIFLVTLKSNSSDTDTSPATREIFIGCARSFVGQKKSAEWSIDGLQQISNLGFNIDPLKGSVDAGSKRPITLTWSPQPGQNTNVPVEGTINCTLKSDVTEVFKLMLRGIVLSK